MITCFNQTYAYADDSQLWLGAYKLLMHPKKLKFHHTFVYYKYNVFDKKRLDFSAKMTRQSCTSKVYLMNFVPKKMHFEFSCSASINPDGFCCRKQSACIFLISYYSSCKWNSLGKVVPAGLQCVGLCDPYNPCWCLWELWGPSAYTAVILLASRTPLR